MGRYYYHTYRLLPVFGLFGKSLRGGDVEVMWQTHGEQPHAGQLARVFPHTRDAGGVGGELGRASPVRGVSPLHPQHRSHTHSPTPTHILTRWAQMWALCGPVDPVSVLAVVVAGLVARTHSGSTCGTVHLAPLARPTLRVGVARSGQCRVSRTSRCSLGGWVVLS